MTQKTRSRAEEERPTGDHQSQERRAPGEGGPQEGTTSDLIIAGAGVLFGPLGGLVAQGLLGGGGAQQGQQGQQAQQGQQQGGGTGNQTPAQTPTATLSAPALVTVGDNVNLTAAVSGGVATGYTFEIKRASGGSWFALGTGTAAQATVRMRCPGNMKVRVTAQTAAAPAVSNEAAVTVQFMDLATVKTNATCVAWFNAAWASTKAATSDGSRREEGFWIQYNSTTLSYQKAGETVGNTVNNTTGAALNGFPAAPADSPAAPAPNAGGTFTVAWYHTHTPTRWRTGGRGTGPSDGDYAWSTSYGRPGLAHDYTVDPAPEGHPIDSPVRLYDVVPPSRRATPP